MTNYDIFERQIFKSSETLAERFCKKETGYFEIIVPFLVEAYLVLAYSIGRMSLGGTGADRQSSCILYEHD